jgi:hypothetical protein
VVTRLVDNLVETNKANYKVLSHNNQGVIAMDRHRPSYALVIAFITTQVLGSATLWASEQRDIHTVNNDQALIAAMSGEQLTVQSRAGSKPLHFRDIVDAGDQIATGDGTSAEVLIGRRAVVTIRPNTTVKLATLSLKQTTIQVTQGIVRVAASATALGEQDAMTIQTPNGQVQTRGGIVRVMINDPVGATEQTLSGEAKPYLVSASSNMMLSELNIRGDIVQVKEGSAEIAGAGPGGEALTVQAGQQVMLKAGQAESIGAPIPPSDMHAEVLANADHANTPQQGREHLIALQVDQATQLGHALTKTVETCLDDSAELDLELTGAVKTCQENPTEKDNVQNAIIGPTGGVKLVSILFGSGSASTSDTRSPINSTGSGFGHQSSNGRRAVLSTTGAVKINGGENTLLVFTKKEPVEAIVIEEIELQRPSNNIISTYEAGSVCGPGCINDHRDNDALNNLKFEPIMTIASEFRVERELVLVGGSPNEFHGGIAPTERLIVRGAGERSSSNINIFSKITASASNPEGQNPGRATGFPPEILETNSTFVIRDGIIDNHGNSTLGVQAEGTTDDPLFGGVLGQFADNSQGPAEIFLGESSSRSVEELSGIVTLAYQFCCPDSPSLREGVTGAITAAGSNVVLNGGVTLDQGTVTTIGTTEATNNYFSDSTHKIPGAEIFDGSLLSVIDGPNDVPTTVIVKDRLLGVYDGSKVLTPNDGENKALLSVLDANLTGPDKVPLIDIDAAFTFDRDGNATASKSKPSVKVKSALVTRSIKQLDSALLEASAPLLALTQAEMTTTSHFADLAGNQAQSIQLNDALVALNASDLTIQNGHLLNLNDASATVNGFLFSLNDSSTLAINAGTLFSLNNKSSLNLKDVNAFGVFGSGNNKLSITNDLCAAGACGTLVNSVHTPFTVDGSELHVAGVTQDVVLPDGFNVFAAPPDAQPPDLLDISPDAALFHVDSNSTLTINGTDVINP